MPGASNLFFSEKKVFASDSDNREYIF